jgi:hypothetical protein
MFFSLLMNVNLAEEFDNIQKQHPCFANGLHQPKKMEELTPRARFSFVQGLVRRTLAKGFHLPASKWKPSDSFDQFMTILDRHGPMAVTGFFGRPYYRVHPTPMKNRSLVEMFSFGKK